MDLRDLDVKRRQIESDIDRVVGNADLPVEQAKQFLEELKQHIESDLEDLETER